MLFSFQNGINHQNPSKNGKDMAFQKLPIFQCFDSGKIQKGHMTSHEFRNLWTNFEIYLASPCYLVYRYFELTLS